VRMADVGVTADNLEGLSYGPRLPNGNPTLLVISDDNFSTAGSVQINQFLLFELEGTRAEATAAAPSAAVTRTAPPAQIPAALPRTGLASEGALLLVGLGLLGIGLEMRRGS
jgi:hypothetical protein